MSTLLDRFNIHFSPIDADGRITTRDGSFWQYLGIELPPRAPAFAEVFDELVGRESEIRSIIGGSGRECVIPSIFRNGVYFDLTILADPERPETILVVLEDRTRIMRDQQDMVQQRNEISLLRHDLSERNKQLNALNETIRAANHQLESKVRVRTRDLHDSRLSIITKLARVAEFRDIDTGGHIYRIGRSCVLIAKRLGVSAEDCETIFHASLLHDVGKIGIPDAILLKPGALSRGEQAVMERHTLIGAEILGEEDVPLFKLAREVARWHHEKWDGSGYPDGLSGEAIPLVARICSIADVFDALMSKRPYKEAWSAEESLAEIGRTSGTAFDPAVVRAFLAVKDDIVRLRREVSDEEEAEAEFL